MPTGPKVTIESLVGMKGRTPIAALTAYDYPTARLLDEAGIPLLLVGDSLGMVVLGYPDTTHVRIEEMEHHVRAVTRAQPRALIAADLPYGSYQSPDQAVASSRRLTAAGAQAVKAEGGREILPQIQAILASGTPFIGHLGMLPQHVLEEGGYKIKGRSDAERQTLLDDAQLLAAVGAFALVLELVTPSLAELMTRSVPIPTVGIGSGPGCDGQILVTPDLVGGFPWFTPRHVQPRAQTGAETRRAVAEWMASLTLPTQTPPTPTA